LKSALEHRLELLKAAKEYTKLYESKLTPLSQLAPKNPVTFMSVGGGELGDLVLSSAKTQLGGLGGGLKTVVFDRYDGFPAQDAADRYECFDMLNGDLIEKNICKHIPDPTQPHAIFLEVERVNTQKVCQLGIEHGYKIMSTPYGPLICMDRYLTKIMFDELDIPRVEWAYAQSQEEVEKTAKDFGFLVVVKPIMTSSGHGTTIVKSQKDLEGVYEYAVKHARGVGTEVTVERYIPKLKEEGTEVTQLAIRHFDEDGKIVTSLAPPVEHKRPAALYHESWLPSTLPENVKRKCGESAKKIAEFVGGLGVFAVEQFILGDEVYNNEVANRPHDTGMVTRWMLNMDEGGLQLYSAIGLQITPSDLELSREDVFGVAHVVLAPELGSEVEVPVLGWKANEIKQYIRRNGYSGDVWYFGKPNGYSHRRMGLAIGFHESITEARKIAEGIAHHAEKSIVYG